MSKLKEKLETMDLENKSITGAYNSYPEPYLGEFYYGFSNFEEIEEIINKYGGSIVSVSWRDGWNYCNNMHTVYKALQINQECYSDDHRFIYDKYNKEDFVNYAGYDSIKELKEYEEKESILLHLKTFRKLLKECQNVDFGTQYLVEYCGEYEVMDQESLYFCYDTKHQAIGICIDT